MKRRHFLQMTGAALAGAAFPFGVVRAMDYLSVEQAQALMLPGVVLKAVAVTLTAEQLKAIEKQSGVRVRVKTLKAWQSADGRWFLVDEVLGKHEYITWALALDAAGAVQQIEVLQYLETYGDQIRNAKWRAQFTGKRTGAVLKVDEDIQNISGATLSCVHITDGVKRLLATHAVALKNLQTG